VKTTKPTGDGVCPAEVSRAHEIDHLINERAGTRDVNDTDLDDDDDGHSLEYARDSPDPPPHPVQHTAVTRSAPTTAPVSRRRGPANDLLARISGAFDPDAIKARDNERANRTLANTHILTQSQQLRDAQATIDNLRHQLFEMRSSLYDVERARDKAELRVEMLQLTGPGQRGRARQLISCLPKAKRLSYEWHPDGGQCTQWLSAEDSEVEIMAGPSRPRHGLSAARRSAARQRDISDVDSGHEGNDNGSNSHRYEGTPEV
jgi:hypothetical protein